MNNHFLSTQAQVVERALTGLTAGPLPGASLWLRKEEAWLAASTRARELKAVAVSGAKRAE